MSTISELLRPYPIPIAANVRQTFCADMLEDVESHLLRELEENCAPIRPGERIAITCGSRGIDQYVTLVRTIVRFVRAKGGQPFLVPSMGSHGDATAEGAIAVRIYYKPMVLMIWWGPVLMAFGGVLSLSDRRLRVGAPKPARAKQRLQPAE